MGVSQLYESYMNELIREYKSLNFNDRKLRFTEFIRREADCFAKSIETVNINNVSNDAFNSMMNQRNQFLRQLFDTKDVCVVF